MAKIWIKLWHDFLHDNKLSILPEHLQLRFVKLLLIAGDIDKNGLLPPVSSVAYDLGLIGKNGEEKVLQTYQALRKTGVLEETPRGWNIVNFSHRQVSPGAVRMRRYRERHSDGSGDVTASESGSTFTFISSSKPKEESIKSQEKGASFLFYEQNIGFLTPMIAEKIKDAEDEFPAEWILNAMGESVKHNKRSWAYVEAILRRWKTEGKQSRRSKSNGDKPEHGKSSLPSAFEAWENLCKAWNGEQSIPEELVGGGIAIRKITYTWLHPEVERIGRMLGWPRRFPGENLAVDRAHFIKAWESEAKNG